MNKARRKQNCVAAAYRYLYPVSAYVSMITFGKQNSDLVHEHTEIDSQIRGVVSLVPPGRHCCTEEQAIEKPEFAISQHN